MKKTIFIVSLFFSYACTVFGQSNLSKSDMVKLDFGTLAKKKAMIRSNDASLSPAYQQLLKDADVLLNFKSVSVMDKTDLPPSGDKHDYMSIAPYWWPDSSKTGGVPYIRKDGLINPEVKNYPDKENMPKLCENVYMLSLAYYFSNDEKYAKHAVEIIKVWFLDPATSMHPHLNYGQAVKGITEGRAEGIIEARHFIFLIDAVELLKKSAYFDDGKQTQLKKWFTEFLSWLQTSPIGIDEMNAKNNHGVWYDALCLSIANFINNKPLVNKIVQSAVERLDVQMDDNGYFPLELQRTTSLHYTVFVLDAFTIIAQLSENTNINFWTMSTRSNKSLRKGFETLISHLSGTKEWTWPQIKPFTFSNSFQILLKASTKYNCSSCKDIIKMHTDDYDKMLLNLL